MANGWTTGFGNTTPWNDSVLASYGQAQQQDPLANDPTTPTTQTSVSRIVGASAPQQAGSTGGTMAQAATADSSGTSPSWMSLLGGQNKLSVSTGTPVTQQAPNATGATNYGQLGSWTNSYTGPQVVSFRTGDGNTVYYKFNASTGMYEQAAQAYQGGYTNYSNGGLTADQMSQAQAGSLGGGVQLQGYKDTVAADTSNVNKAYSTAEDSYRNAYSAQQTQQSAAALAAQNSSDSSYILDYMVQHGGAAPPVNRPGMSGVPMSQAAFDAASAQYKANNSANFVNALQLQAPDTSAVDQNGLAALLALNSQYQTGASGADQIAQQAAAGGNLQYQAGQNLLAHNTDYASKYNSNLATYSDAVQKQFQSDTNATGVKLQSDIQAMADQLQALSQSSEQLGATQRQQVQAAIQQLQNQIAAYSQAANEHGANSQQALTLATAALSGGGSLAAGLVTKA